MTKQQQEILDSLSKSKQVAKDQLNNTRKTSYVYFERQKKLAYITNKLAYLRQEWK